MQAAPAPLKTPVARWRYVVPNAITLLSLLLGLVAVVHAFAGDTHEAAWLVVLCVLLDKLDGTAARLLRATSRIGVQLDSFADFVTFGIAPSAIVFARLAPDPTGAGAFWAEDPQRTLLFALVAAYPLATAVRLAKFNVLHDVLPADGPKVFYGLPSTFAGGLLAVLFIIAEDYALGGLLTALPFVSLAFALFMVSNLPLPKLALRKSKALNAFQLVNILVGYTCGTLRLWPEYILGAVLIYALVGFTWGFIHRRELTAARRLDPYPT